MAVTNSTQLPVQKRAWETRERILAAAVACLAEDGYAATTTSRIQERAGVSRGSLLHQFPARDDLLIAAVQHLAESRTAELEAPATRSTQTIEAAVDSLWSTFNGPLFRAALELWVAAQHSPELAAALAPREHELGRRIRTSITQLFGPQYSEHAGMSELLTLLVTSMRGVALTYAFESRDYLSEPTLVLWKQWARRALDVEN